MSGEIRIAFGGDEHPFRLDIGRLRAVQDKCDCGPMELHNRFASGRWRIDDVREVLFQGLVGGGMNQSDATRLVKSNFDGNPILPFVSMADNIVLAALVGPPDEKPGELRAEAAKPKIRSRAKKSASDPSTD